jgi:hypothetical protein
MEQLGPTVRRCRSTMSRESPFQLRPSRAHATSSRAEHRAVHPDSTKPAASPSIYGAQPAQTGAIGGK